MRRARDYFNYEITNGLYHTVSGSDTIKEARNIVKELIKDDCEFYGYPTTREDYHIFKLNRYTGERLTEVN